MRLSHHIRKTVKWGGAVLTLTLFAVWVGTTTYRFHLTLWRGFFLTASSGGMTINRHWWVPPAMEGRFRPPLSLGYMRMGFSPPTCWWFSGELRTSQYAVNTIRIDVPLWTLVAPSLAATMWAWRLDALARRRPRTESCSACGYSREGLATRSVCPECGMAANAPRPAAISDPPSAATA